MGGGHVTLWEKMRRNRGMEWAAAAVAAGALALWLTGSGRGGTAQEKRIGEMLSSIEGAGRVQVMVSEGARDGERQTRVVVIAQGAEDVRVAVELSRAACLLTGAEPEWVEVFAMGPG